MEEETTVSRGAEHSESQRFKRQDEVHPCSRRVGRQRPPETWVGDTMLLAPELSLTGQSKVFLGAGWPEYQGYCLINTEEIKVDDQEAEYRHDSLQLANLSHFSNWESLIKGKIRRQSRRF